MLPGAVSSHSKHQITRIRTHVAWGFQKTPMTALCPGSGVGWIKKSDSRLSAVFKAFALGSDYCRAYCERSWADCHSMMTASLDYLNPSDIEC